MLPDTAKTPDTLSNTVITIERMACRFNIPSGVENPAQVETRLRRIAGRDAPRACGQALSFLDGADDAVYRIRDLSVDVWVDLQTMTQDQIARRWGHALSVGIAQAIGRAHPQNTIRFDSPRHFVTAFIRDLMDGRAWGRWYYSEFRAMEQLPAARIAVQLLSVRPEWIAPVLADLEPTGHAQRLIESWGQREIDELWDALGLPSLVSLGLSQHEQTLASQVVSQVASLRSTLAVSGGVDASSRARDRLRLMLAVDASQSGTFTDRVLAGVVGAVVDLTALLSLHPELEPVLAMESGLHPAAQRLVASGPLADAVPWLTQACASAHGRKFLAQMTQVIAADSTNHTLSAFQPQHKSVGSSDRVRPSVSTSKDTDGGSISGEPAESDPSASEARPAFDRRPFRQSSSVGSIFLLAPALAELGIWDRWNDELGDETARRYLFILALKALGRERASLLLGDTALAAFAGLSEPPVADARMPVGEGMSSVGWLHQVPQIAARWYPSHQREVAQAVSQDIDVLRDFASGCWLAARPIGSDENTDTKTAWESTLAAVGDVRRSLSETEQDILDAEMTHFRLGGRLGYPWLTPSLDAALSVIASLAMRRMASGLSGLTQSSPAYLARQFLAQPATLEFDAEGLTVHLSGGPLVVVLRMAPPPEEITIPWLPYPLRIRLPGGLGF